MKRTGRRLWNTSILLRASGALIVAYLLVVLVSASSLGHLHTGDTDLLVQGARQTLRCLGRDHLIGCGHQSGSVLSQVGPYALLQYLPAMIFAGSGLTNDQAIRALAYLNLASFAGCLLVVASLSRRLRPAFWGPLVVVALVGSSLTYQSTSGFGEMLAAFVALLAVAATLARRPLLICLTMAVATTGKETFAPFLLVLGLLAGRGERDRLMPPSRVWVPVVAGVVAGQLLNLGFDVFRFGVARNLTYLQPIFRTPGFGNRMSYLAGVWFAPSSGVLWYWPLATLIIVVLGFASAVHLFRAPRELSIWLPPLIAVGTLVVFSVGLADWYSPFGWIAYGPRLMVPILPAGLVVAVYTGGRALGNTVRRLVTRVSGAILLGVVAVAGGWAQFGAPWTWLSSIEKMELPSGGCPSLTHDIIQNGPEPFYHCVQVVMWRLHPFVPVVHPTAGGSAALTARALLALASALLIAEAVVRSKTSPLRAK